VLRRSYAGFRGHRPLASFLLLGPTGVGKTETARAIAEALFDGESALVRIDLSEYSEAHSIARLIGSPPGYVAHEDGGQLTEAIRRRPASVVLLDELEKANREVLLVLLQILEDGRLTDGRGRTVDFSSAAVVMTSNLGSECYRRSRTPPPKHHPGPGPQSPAPGAVESHRRSALLRPAVRKRAWRRRGSHRRDSSRRLQAERGIAFSIDDSVIEEVCAWKPTAAWAPAPCAVPSNGWWKAPLANEIVAGRLHRGARLSVVCNERWQGRRQKPSALPTRLATVQAFLRKARFSPLG
jgi:ATP-dependent Clp protease ATP-binding subunit ClpC